MSYQSTSNTGYPFHTYLYFQKKLILIFILSGLVLMLTRGVFILRFSDTAFWHLPFLDYLRFLVQSLKFDIQITCYLFLPLFVFATIVAPFIPRKVQLINTIFKIYTIIIVSLIFIIQSADIQYYSFFKSHYHFMLFGFFNEEPLALMQTIWHEQPILIFLLCIGIGIYSIIRGAKWIANVTIKTKQDYVWWQKTCLVILSVTLYIIGLRGSLGTFPLQKEAMNVSQNNFMNTSVPNSLYALYLANQEYHIEFKQKTITKIAQEKGFENIEHALHTFYQKPFKELNPDALDTIIFSPTKVKLADPQPHIIVVFMESWSTQLIRLHSPETNLLGPLEKHLKQGTLWSRFQSTSDGGTIGNLEAFINSTPYHSLFDSKYRRIPFKTGIGHAFQQGGYETRFVTGLELTWRNLNEALPHQGFQNTQGMYHIFSTNPKAQRNEAWGAYDEYLFNALFKQLTNAQKPQFIYALTSSNHTPFELPKDYPLPPLQQTEHLKTYFQHCEYPYMEYLKGFQYANFCAGVFLDSLMASPLREQTIVVLTGDHNVRAILPFETEHQKHERHLTPFYIYVPEKYKKYITLDTTRFASHRDIIPSLLQHFVPNTYYLNLTQDMFQAPNPSVTWFSDHEGYHILTHQHANLDAITQKIKARDAILEYYFNRQFEKLKPE